MSWSVRVDNLAVLCLLFRIDVVAGLLSFSQSVDVIVLRRPDSDGEAFQILSEIHSRRNCIVLGAVIWDVRLFKTGEETTRENQKRSSVRTQMSNAIEMKPQNMNSLPASFARVPLNVGSRLDVGTV